VEITIRSTQCFALLNGTECRVWLGESAKGTPIKVYVLRLEVKDGDAAELAAELQETEVPEILVVLCGKSE
jgi:hypothetical protein